MIARRSPRRRRTVQAPALLAVAAAALGVLALVDMLAHAWPLLVAAAGLGAYALGRRHGRATPSPRPDPERERLAAEVDRLRREVADARESAELAWDAAAEAPPPPPCPACGSRIAYSHSPGCPDGPNATDAAATRAALLADPRSGARPLGPG